MRGNVKPNITIDNEARWSAVLKRDKTQDGRFVFGVLTTGVYCRPSCPARKPLRENVRFYETTQEAERAGLHACKRCRPTDETNRDADFVRELCDFIKTESATGNPVTLAALSARVKISAFHLQRKFKAAVGVTPKQYLAACRMANLKSELRRQAAVTPAIYEAGFGAGSRVYERANGRLGMTPKAYAERAKGVRLSHAFLETDFGLLLLAATDRGVCFVQFGDSRQDLLQRLRDDFPEAILDETGQRASQQFEAWQAALSEYLRRQPSALALPVDVRATAFQEKVWRYLQSIPSGEVRTYSQVAQAIGQPGAARAVGQACGSNRVAIVVPCHRVLRGDSGIGGYRWGVERKRKLLAFEQAAASGRL